jgi:hypothetical protein
MVIAIGVSRMAKLDDRNIEKDPGRCGGQATVAGTRIRAVSNPDMNRLGELDEPQLEWATQEHRVLVTFNVGHFAQLHYQWMASSRHHAGLIVSRQRSIGEVMRRLLHLARTLEADDMLDRLEYLSNWWDLSNSS